METSCGRSDGTDAGTFMLGDLTAGSAGSSISLMQHFNGQLLFAPANALWKTDGTIPGTTLIASTPSIQQMGATNDFFFFSMNDGVIGRELYKTDGTPSGTGLVKDISLGDHNSNGIPNSFTNPRPVATDNEIFFMANNGPSGANYLIWKSDGTSDGTTLASGALPTTSLSSDKLIVVNNEVYFKSQSSQGIQLLKTDGQMTRMVKTLALGSAIIEMKEFNDQLFFTANEVPGGKGYELWVSDGSSVGTNLLADINAGDNASSSPELFAPFSSGDILLSASKNSTGRELMKFSSSTGSIEMVKDINPGINSGLEFGDQRLLNNKAIFRANDGVSGMEIWASDGTATGTVMLKDIYPGAGGSYQLTAFSLAPEPNFTSNKIHSVNQATYFAATDGFDEELWKTDGTPAGTLQVKEISIGHAFPHEFNSVSNLLIFSAQDTNNNHEPWVCDGTESGTFLLKDINPTGSSFPKRLTPVNETLFFTAYDGTNGRELWKTNGTIAGTTFMKDIANGAVSSHPQLLTSAGARLFFTADDGNQGRELWTSDGTAHGTVIVKDIWSGAKGSNPQNLIAANSKIFFTADDGVNGYSLWISDGTEAGTLHLKNFGSGETFANHFINLNDVVYFQVKSNLGWALWKSEGSTCSTIQLTTPSQIQITGPPVLVNQKIYFQAYSPEVGKELFYYDPATDIGAGCKLYQTIAFTDQTKTYGDNSFDLGATSSSSLPVTFVSSDPAVLSITGNLASIHQVGEVLVTASQPGNSEFHAAVNSVKRITIQRASQSVNVSPITAKKFGDAPFTITASSSISLPVVLTSSDSEVISLSENVATIHKAGRVVITATQAGNTNYAPESSTIILVVAKASQQITFDAITNKTMGDSPFSPPASSSAGLAVTLLSASDKVKVESNVVSLLSPGRVILLANQAGNDNYEASQTVERSFCILPAQPTVQSQITGLGVLLTSSATTGNQWYLNGQPIAGATQATYLAGAEGNYSVKVSVDDCSSSMSVAIDLIITGIETSAHNGQLYPNPAQHEIVVDLSSFNSERNVKLTLLTSSGALIREIETNRANGSIDVTDLPSGNYIVRVNQGNRNVLLRFVKN